MASPSHGSQVCWAGVPRATRSLLSYSGSMVSSPSVGSFTGRFAVDPQVGYQGRISQTVCAGAHSLGLVSCS